MKTTYGFRATMTARHAQREQNSRQEPHNGLVGPSASNRDLVHVAEGWTTREAHAENFASERARALVARIAPLLGAEPQYQDEVPEAASFAVEVLP